MAVAASGRSSRGSVRNARTLVEALELAFRDALRAPEGTSEPVALLWTDPKGQWEPLVARIRPGLQHLYVLGDYNPAARMGPAIWLRCVVDGSLPDVAPPAGVTPILYLPGVSVQELRQAADCPRSIQPLIDLLFRGCTWTQRGGRDWTVEAFIGSKDGLGLDLAQDALTREALLRALPLLADAPLDGLRDRRLEAEDFDRLAVTDPKRDLLRWMDDEEGFRRSGDDGRWRSFCAVCRAELQFDPEKQAPADAAASLAEGSGKWGAVWERFRESPQLYPGVSVLLRSILLPLLARGSERDPRSNSEAEARLRHDLEQVAGLPQADAIARVLVLEEEHGQRRSWAWAQLGESPFAVALEPLARLASLAKSPSGGGSLDAAIESYTTSGWQCDRAALEAVCAAPRPNEAPIIASVVKVLYEPWLDASARHFQGLVAADEELARSKTRGAAPSVGECVVFADGLRFDIAASLREQLGARGHRVTLNARLAPIPSVTATAKPLAAGLEGQLEGAEENGDFVPRLRETKQPATAQRIRDLLAARDVELLGEETRGPTSAGGKGWVETGRLDEFGHKIGAHLAHQLGRETEQLVARIESLLESGWPRIRVVTDHGWLLLPRGLPRVDLPKYLVATRWARCASVQGGAQPAIPVLGWYWNSHARIAWPPGIACFMAGNEYAHGGVSPQECIIPELVVEREAKPQAAKIEAVSWRGMRCRVRVSASDPAIRVDLRLNWKLAETSIAASTKEIGTSSEASLAVADDSHEGAAVSVVVLDASGAVLDRKPTTVGEAT